MPRTTYGAAAAILILAVAACRNEPRATAATAHGTFVVHSRTLVRAERLAGGCRYRTPEDRFHRNTTRRRVSGRLRPLVPWLCVALYERGEFRGAPRSPETVRRNDHVVTETVTFTHPNTARPAAPSGRPR